MAVLRNSQEALIWEIAGGISSYAFVPRTVDAFNTELNFYGGVHIGNVTDEQEYDVEMLLRTIPVVRGDPNWDCQVWVLKAIRKIWEETSGIMDRYWTEAEVRAKMDNEKVLADSGEDTVEGRLFP